ncbi:hypothetical protein AKJ40_04265 [candidate division MSBL1 archaeon SCGC-AAA259M10]|uniref:Calcineurin-like phosphoesterase domain-containing protein n=2 Tax=candidate division MSBL1 TaxID=215777 RepID=A0A133UXR2_9EURY|nr:hypothetical protein AKJ66_03990 [candidate division MSBL1 archaeon SCGC-AAA259E22]KXA98970.1 hypothetical protein AKJ40_04265 [candidate division MSBL1 archaeon SCGC-AAA259M10]
MAEIEFVHLADTHLGYRQYGLEERFKDWGKATKQSVDYAVEKDVDMVIHSGDLFNSNKIDQDALVQAFEIFEPLKKKDIPLLVIEGNHDRRRGRQKNTTMDVLDRLGYCTFLDPGGRDISNAIYEIKEYNVIGLGYPGMYLKNWIDDYAEQLPENRKNNIILLHAGVEGYIESMASHVTPSKLKELKQKSIYLALGHFHDSFQLDNWAFNPGSVERERFDRKEKSKIFYHVKIQDGVVEAEKVQLNTRNMFQFDLKANDNWKQVKTKLREKVEAHDLEESMVRVRIFGKLESEFKRWELEELFGDEPLVLKIFDETYSEEKKSEWKGMESHEIEKDILVNYFENDFEDPEALADFVRSILDNILEKSLSSSDEAKPLAKDIANWRRDNL